MSRFYSARLWIKILLTYVCVYPLWEWKVLHYKIKHSWRVENIYQIIPSNSYTIPLEVITSVSRISLTCMSNG